jgi:putative alpha-1,2-mannosidase
MYGGDKYGLAFSGMDDQGLTSSRYVMSAMGFYTIDPSLTVSALPVFGSLLR